MKNLTVKNLKLFKKLHVNRCYENISKFHIYFSETFFCSLSKLLCEIKQYSAANEKSYLPLNEHKLRSYFEKKVITHL